MFYYKTPRRNNNNKKYKIMTKQEFENRVMMNVSNEEYVAIEIVYMNSDLEKDEFCKMWAKMNAKRIKVAKAIAMETARIQALKDNVYNMFAKRRYLSFEESTKLAPESFTEKEIDILKQVNIKIEYLNANGIRYFESVGYIVYLMSQYLHIA